MSPTTKARKSRKTRDRIMEAARGGLLTEGYAALSTRKVADSAEVPLSQLHYHFGGKQQLILSVLERENERLLERHSRLYGEERPLSERYEQACDFLEEDLDSGYVRVLQEMIAVSWSDERIADSVRQVLQGWIDLLTEVAEQAEDAYGPLSPFSAKEVAALIGLAFMGGESMLMLGFSEGQWPIRSTLRRIGDVIREREQGGAP